MEYIPVEKKTVGFLPKRGNLSKAFSLEVRYHSTTNIQRYMGGEICIIKIQIYNGDSYSKKYSFEAFSQKMPPIFHFSWKPGDWRPIVDTSVEAACLCWPGAVNCCLFALLFAFYLFCAVSFVYFVCTLFSFSLTRCCSLLLYCTSFCFRLCLQCFICLLCVYIVYFFVACLCFFCYMVSSKKMLSELVDVALFMGACLNPLCRTVIVSKGAVYCTHNQC